MPEPLRSIAGTPDQPLEINGIQIHCYVLEDETRVLSQRGVFRGVGIRRGGSQVERGDDALLFVPRFMRSLRLSPHIPDELMNQLNSPIVFSQSGVITYGYRATIIVDICEVILQARDAGALGRRYKDITARCELLLRGFARVGVIALVDEATGYQKIRAQRALAEILEKFIATELQPWTKTFPYEFYEQIFRLKGWPGPQGTRRPSVIGKYTNDFIYHRLAPGVLDELRRKNPVLPAGYRKDHHHQWFTPDVGHPKLKEHISGVIALMRAAPNWESFQRLIARSYPKMNQQLPMYDEDL